LFFIGEEKKVKIFLDNRAIVWYSESQGFPPQLASGCHLTPTVVAPPLLNSQSENSRPKYWIENWE
jgi:hypothetical protein